MKDKLNADWALSLAEMTPSVMLSYTEQREQWQKLAQYIKEQSNNDFLLDGNECQLVQNAKLNWSYLFDVIKAAEGFKFRIAMALPHHFRINKPNPGRGWMYAFYNRKNDTIELRVYTGNRREDLSGYDGFGREPDEIEIVTGMRDRDGNWVKELDFDWI